MAEASKEMGETRGMHTSINCWPCPKLTLLHGLGWLLKDIGETIEAIHDIPAKPLIPPSRVQAYTDMVRGLLQEMADGFGKISEELARHTVEFEEGAQESPTSLSFVVLVNEEAGEVNCERIGHTFTIHKGPAIFSWPSLEPVCPDCARKYAPDLAALVEVYQRVRASDEPNAA